MQFFKINASLIAALIISPVLANAEPKPLDSHTQEARMLVKAFAGDLQSVLKTAMQDGGPIAALEACNIEAGDIARNNSAASGWSVGRTSLKVRNADNAPDAWELKTLLSFEQRKAAGTDASQIEHAEVLTNDSGTVFRYMKAIPTSGLCISCHGNHLSPAVSKKVNSLYPHDKAVGFAADDIRGAFSMQKALK